jgi:SpoVK/Ycf46/Vps4 family AAA+-type ATPase
MRSHSRLLTIPDYVEERRAEIDETLVYSPDVSEAVFRVGQELGSFAVAPRALLFGTPGMGKTATLRNWSKDALRPFWWVRADQMFSAFLGGTVSNIAAVFSAAVKSHAVLVFDDFDAFARRRDDPRESGESRRAVIGLLAAIDGTQGVVPVLAATNVPAVLDAAVLRRFPDLINFAKLDDRTADRLLRFLFPAVEPSGECLELVVRLSPAELADIAKKLGPAPTTDAIRRALEQRVEALAAMGGEV